MLKSDKRIGVKPDKQISKSIARLLKNHTGRKLAELLDTDYLVLKKIANGGNAMPYKLAELKDKIEELENQE